MSIDPVWHRDQIEQYIREREDYVVYAQTLEQIFRRAVKEFAPLSIVQSRPKAVPSFAEKAVRKAHKYHDPVHQLTDLCGARVITITQPQCDAICRFILKHFEVDQRNSLDVGALLEANEFGYRSMHYVVQMRPGEILGVPIPERILPNPASPFKAEIQVRTLLQHAWSEISHDRIYKNEIKVPQAIQRESARLAALLEEAEETFARFVEGIDSYIVHYGARMSREQIESELAMLALIRENEKDDEARLTLALRAARIAKGAGLWRRVAEDLEPFAESGNAAAVRDLGHALCQIDREEVRAQGYRRGQALLTRSIELAPGDAEAHAMLALSYSRILREGERTRDLYRRAYELAPENPYHLAAFLEYEVGERRNESILSPLAPVLRAGIEKCKAHIAVGIELPWAHFVMGRLLMLLGEGYEALMAYTRGIDVCLAAGSGVSEEVLDTEIDSLDRLRPADKALPGREWERRSTLEVLRSILLLAKSIRFHADAPLRALKQRIRVDLSTASTVAIVAGGCQHGLEDKLAVYRDPLCHALELFDGVVISGGTKSGVCEILGDAAERFQDRRTFRLIGYHPARIPADVSLDRRYDELVKGDGEDFSPLDALQGWVDAIASGIQARTVCVLGINGGRIAAFEFRLALALGAQVGVIEGSGRAVDELLKDSFWGNHSRLLKMPADPMTLAAFLLRSRPLLGPEDLEQAAQAIHANFREENRHTKVDPAMRPWENLDEKFRNSNREQAAFATQVLKRAGYAVRPATGDNALLPDFTPEEIETMAELEHGRWVIERLSTGWTPGPRDPDQKKTPYLVGWDALTDDVKKYDRDAVKKLPEVLRRVGLEVYRETGV